MSDTLLGLLCFALTLLFYYASKWLYGKKRILPLMPLLLAGLLTGCAAKSPVYDAACPLPAPKPIVAQPMPHSTYSSSAQTNIEQWRKRLTSTQVMQ